MSVLKAVACCQLISMIKSGKETPECAFFLHTQKEEPRSEKYNQLPCSKYFEVIKNQ